ncbi:MAG: GntR family transcriptional regulator [Planctomycetaceae bacterium]|nr:GntR family transcriptional regulator [Planctomycetaceae bacterium]
MAAAEPPSTSRRRPSTNTGVEHGQRRRLVVEQLLTSIFQGKLKAGERLVIQDLARRFEMSPTPIREALVTLEGIGIVDIAPNCGAVVRRVTRSDVREVCQVRRALECTAVRSACGRISSRELNELATEFRQRASGNGRQRQRSDRASNAPRNSPVDSDSAVVDQARELDSRLHDLIAQSCGNRFLSRELGRLKLLFRTFRDVAWARRSAEQDLMRLPEEAAEHLEIVDALLDGNAKRASDAMAVHIRSGGKYWSHGLSTESD